MKHHRSFGILSFVTRAFVCLILVAAAIGVAGWLYDTRSQPTASDDAGGAPRAGVLALTPLPVRRQWVGYGTAAAMDTVDVPAEVGAIVAERPAVIEPGRPIAAGDVIARLDADDFISQRDMITQRVASIDAQLRQLEFELTSWTQRRDLAREAMEIARRIYERYRDARGSSGVIDLEVDRAEDTLKAKEQAWVSATEEVAKIEPRRQRLAAERSGLDVELAMARNNIRRSVIVAPISGVLQEVDIEVGENLVPGSRVARIVNLDRVEVPLRLPAAARVDLALGDQASIRSVGRDQREWRGVIARIAPADDERTRTVTVYVEIESTDVPLAPGRFVEGVITGRHSEARFALPRRAVERDRALFVEDGIVRAIAIEVDYHVRATFPELPVDDDEWVVVNTTLPDEMLLILNPTSAVRPGAAVTPVRIERAARSGDGEGAS
ncbi:MAG: HlyD family efflux transporter periplasmic adaptor subunit [Phycisphaerales bacterium]|nr:HlyD family efflux transporter periplasmic adaptor subunit [Phycisphaerales bacterium]